MRLCDVHYYERAMTNRSIGVNRNETWKISETNE